MFLRKSTASSLKIKEQEEAENIFLSLATSGNAMSFFDKLAKCNAPSVERKPHYILINHAEKNKSIIYPVLKFSPLSIDDMTKIVSEVKKENAQKIIIFCGYFEKGLPAFAKNFDENIIVLDRYSGYAFYKSCDCFPEVSMQYKKDKALALRDLIGLMLNKNKAKGYLICAIFLFLSSVLIRTSLYYCIFASILLILALISYSNPFSQEGFKEEVL